MLFGFPSQGGFCILYEFVLGFLLKFGFDIAPETPHHHLVIALYPVVIVYIIQRPANSFLNFPGVIH